MSNWKSNLVWHLSSSSILEIPKLSLDWVLICTNILRDVFSLDNVSELILNIPAWGRVEDAKQLSKGSNMVMFVLRTKGYLSGAIYVGINKASLYAILAKAYKSPDLKYVLDLDKDILDNLLGFAAARFCNRLHEQGVVIEGSLELNISWDQNMDDPVLIQTCSFISDIGQIMCLLFLEASVINSWNTYLLSQANNFQMLCNSSSIANLYLEVCFDIGRAMLKMRHILELEVGDCILIEWGRYFNRQGILDLSIDNKALFSGEVSKDGENVVINDVSPFGDFDEGANMSEMLKNAAKDQSGEDAVAKQSLEFLDKAEVCVVFELGKTNIKIKDLLAVQTGYMFKLPKGESVLLRVQGQYIGAGIIVRLGDSLGIQVIDTTIA